VFLDRDGILNEKMPEGQYVTRWRDFHVLPGVPEALRRLNEAGLRVIVVSNQRGIALGLYTASDVETMHAAFQRLLKGAGARVDASFICPHDKGQCNCRKPLPGLFEQAVAMFPEIKAATSAMIGDALSDIEFGRRLGMTTIFIEGDPERRKPGAEKAANLADMRFATLAQAVEALLAAH
jgi:D-glycero-D-manno-heptose 1,7-bisphosphate phosphatase